MHLPRCRRLGRKRRGLSREPHRGSNVGRATPRGSSSRQRQSIRIGGGRRRKPCGELTPGSPRWPCVPPNAGPVLSSVAGATLSAPWKRRPYHHVPPSTLRPGRRCPPAMPRNRYPAGMFTAGSVKAWSQSLRVPCRRIHRRSQVGETAQGDPRRQPGLRLPANPAALRRSMTNGSGSRLPGKLDARGIRRP